MGKLTLDLDKKVKTAMEYEFDIKKNNAIFPVKFSADIPQCVKLSKIGGLDKVQALQTLTDMASDLITSDDVEISKETAIDILIRLIQTQEFQDKMKSIVAESKDNGNKTISNTSI